MNLIDANILIYPVNSDSAHHDRVRRRFEAALSGADADPATAPPQNVRPGLSVPFYE
jgi:hypothetical protein